MPVSGWAFAWPAWRCMEVKAMTNGIRIAGPVVAILLASVGVLGLLLTGCQAPSTATEKRSATAMPTTAEIEARIPPIDAARPNQTETATFAMG